MINPPSIKSGGSIHLPPMGDSELRAHVEGCGGLRVDDEEGGAAGEGEEVRKVDRIPVLWGAGTWETLRGGGG